MTQAFSLTAANTTPAEGMYAYMPNNPHRHNAEFYSSTSTDTISAGAFAECKELTTIISSSLALSITIVSFICLSPFECRVS